MAKGGLSTRRMFFFTPLAPPIVLGLAVETLRVRAGGAFLRVAAPQLQFLSGRPLQRLRNGATVIFLFQLSMSTDRFTTVAHRSFERFAFSYDLWEEKFAVTRLGTARLATSPSRFTSIPTCCLVGAG